MALIRFSSFGLLQQERYLTTKQSDTSKLFLDRSPSFRATLPCPLLCALSHRGDTTQVLLALGLEARPALRDPFDEVGRHPRAVRFDDVIEIATRPFQDAGGCD
jgi:hypothetical protein